jgi:hypothetical protein
VIWFSTVPVTTQQRKKEGTGTIGFLCNPELCQVLDIEKIMFAVSFFIRERSNQLLQTALIDFPDVLLPLLGTVDPRLYILTLVI